MECTGELQGISKDWKTGKWMVAFSINEESVLNTIDGLKDSLLSIKAVKYRKKRSLDANAYLWVICTKLADILGTSKDEVYEEMLQRYGELYQDENGDYVVITLKSSIDTSKIDGHWKHYRTSADGKFKSYLMIKGTSQYDTAEMSRFVDKVVQEAKDEGIETLPPNELANMKALWGVDVG